MDSKRGEIERKLECSASVVEREVTSLFTSRQFDTLIDPQQRSFVFRIQTLGEHLHLVFPYALSFVPLRLFMDGSVLYILSIFKYVSLMTRVLVVTPCKARSCD